MKKISHLLEYIFLVAAGFILRRLPYGAASGMGSFFGKILYVFDKKHRKIAYENLKPSFSGKSDAELKGIIKRLYDNMGRSFTEFLYLPKLSLEKLKKLIKVKGEEHLKAALSKGRGAVVIVSHFGNWELMGARYTEYGSCTVIAFPQSNALTDKVITRYRTNAGMRIIFTGNTVKEIFRALRNNGMVGFLADQDAHGEGIFIDFFGRPASTNRGPAVMALKTKAAMIMSFIIREKNNTFTLHFEPELPLVETGDFEADVRKNTENWSAVLEKYVKEYPDHWFWVHRRWKTRPIEK
ncbi:MAG: lysophospholipid acyltransferase family protein [Candidatus Firestonebacteria bacterium]